MTTQTKDRRPVAELAALVNRTLASDEAAQLLDSLIAGCTAFGATRVESAAVVLSAVSGIHAMALGVIAADLRPVHRDMLLSTSLDIYGNRFQQWVIKLGIRENEDGLRH